MYLFSESICHQPLSQSFIYRMRLRMYVVITFAVIYIFQTSNCGYLPPRYGYHYGIAPQFKTLVRPENVIRDIGITKAVSIKKPVIDINADNVKNFLKSKVEIEDPIDISKEIEISGSDEIVVPAIKLPSINTAAIKSKCKYYGKKLHVKTKDINFKQRASDLKLKLAPKFNSIKLKYPSVKNAILTKYHSTDCGLRLRKAGALLKSKGINLGATLNTRYSLFMASPRTQLYWNNIKARAPLLKYRSAVLLKHYKANMPKINMKKVAPALVTAGLLKRRLTRSAKLNVDYNFKNLKANIIGKKFKLADYPLCEGLLKKKMKINLGKRGYTVKMNKNKLRSLKASYWRPGLKKYFSKSTCGCTVSV